MPKHPQYQLCTPNAQRKVDEENGWQNKKEKATEKDIMSKKKVKEKKNATLI